MIERLIRKFEQYGPVSEDERQVLERAVSRVDEYSPHQDIVREGDCPSDSCLILDGFAYRYKLLEQGTRQILALHIPGDFCDLHSFVLKRMDHGIAAVSPCSVAKVPHAIINEITETQPRLARAFWWDTAIDAAVTREGMVSMGCRTASQQMAHLFCELFLRLRTVGLVEGTTYDLPVTQAELGDVFGLSTVHVNRVLQELRGAGLVIWDGKRVTIPDLAALMQTAAFSPEYLHVRGGPGRP